MREDLSFGLWCGSNHEELTSGRVFYLKDWLTRQ